MDSFLDLCSDLVVTVRNLEFLKVFELAVEVEVEFVWVLEVLVVKLVAEVVKVFEIEAYLQ